MLLRVLEAAPEANGVGIGIDLQGPDIARARENAEKRGLSGRVSFIEGSATDHASPADAVISCGAYQAFGTVHEGFRPLRIQTATRDEWEEFESGVAAGAED